MLLPACRQQLGRGHRAVVTRRWAGMGSQTVPSQPHTDGTRARGTPGSCCRAAQPWGRAGSSPLSTAPGPRGRYRPPAASPNTTSGQGARQRTRFQRGAASSRRGRMLLPGPNGLPGAPVLLSLAASPPVHSRGSQACVLPTGPRDGGVMLPPAPCHSWVWPGSRPLGHDHARSQTVLQK